MSCGGGKRRRERTCALPDGTERNGRECGGGEDMEEEECNKDKKCPGERSFDCLVRVLHFHSRT